jgi:hypothetical protein
MLAFLTALAFIEVGAGAVVAEAWKLERDRGVLLLGDRYELSQLLDRLRVMEGVVTAGAIATTMVWSVLAIFNAMRVARRGGVRDAVIALGAWVACPVLVLAIAAGDYEDQTTTTAVLLLMLQAGLLYLPFAATGKVSEGVGGQRMPFLRWYMAVLAAYFVQHVFTGPLDLANPSPNDDLGRTAVMYFVNAVIVGVMVVMAAEASRSMQQATLLRSSQRRLLHDDANQRVRVSIALNELPVTLPPSPAFAPPVVPVASGAVPSGAVPSNVVHFPAPVPVRADTSAVSVPVIPGS